MIHPTAVIDEAVHIGDNCKIWHFVHVCSGASIGDAVVLGQNVFVGKDVRIGAGTRVQNNVSIYEGVEIEDDVFLGPSCVFTNIRHPRAFRKQRDAFASTIVRKGASIGANATIVCGYSIGEYALIGAGAVVTRDVRSYALMVGNPARQVGWVCRCGEKLSDSPTPVCHYCGSSYRIGDKECLPTPLSVPDALDGY